MVRTAGWARLLINNQLNSPDGTPGIRLQIPYLEEFFGTMWYLICEEAMDVTMEFEVEHQITQLELDLSHGNQLWGI